MKKISLIASTFVFALLLTGAGCSGTPEEVNADIDVTELGITVTAPAGYDYSQISEGVYHLTTPGNFKTITLQSFGPPDVPAEAVANPEGLADALGFIFDGFDLTNQEEFENGFVIDYIVDDNEAFSAIINTDEGTILCEPEFGSFVFEFDDLKDLCKSIRSTS